VASPDRAIAAAGPAAVNLRLLVRFLSRPANLLLVACVLLVLWLVLVPLVALLYTSFTEQTMFGSGGFTLDNVVDAYKGRHIGLLLWNSVVYATGSAALTFVMGTAVAFVVERTDSPWRGAFHGLALLSFALPGLLTTMAWMLILSPNIGWVNGLLKLAFGLTAAPLNIYSMGGMIWALSSHYFPLAYLLMGPAFRVLDTRMEEAAVVSGARSWQIAARVTLPLLRPAILSTLLLLFVRGIESFEVPRLVGMPARIKVFTTEIQFATSEAPPELGVAGALGLTLLAICVIGIYFYRRATANADAYATVTGKGYKPEPLRLGAWRWPVAITIAAMFLVALGLPLFTLAWQSFFPTITMPSLGAAHEATLSNYTYIFGYPVFLNAIRNSTLLGLMAATIVVVLAFILSWIVQRSTNRHVWTIDALAFTPVAIPGIIIGCAVLFAYLMIPIGVYNTIWILLIAYVTMYLPFGMRFASGGIAQIHRELEEAAQTAGAGSWQILHRVLAPLLAPALIAGWLYIFVLAVRDLAASIFLAGPDTQVLSTISLVIWEEGGSLGAVCALGIVQIVPLIAIVAAMRWIERRLGARL
jgi:iron(III) transport system permease protein